MDLTDDCASSSCRCKFWMSSIEGAIMGYQSKRETERKREVTIELLGNEAETQSDIKALGSKRFGHVAAKRRMFGSLLHCHTSRCVWAKTRELGSPRAGSIGSGRVSENASHHRVTTPDCRFGGGIERGIQATG